MKPHAVRLLGAALSLALSSALAQEPLPVSEEYNVHWNSQSDNSGDSMPCVGGNIGLHQVLGRLVEIAKDVEKRERWQRILATLPDMPTGEVAGHKVLKPTTKHHSLSGHMPEMYPLYPYQMFHLGEPGIELMRNTFLFGVTKEGRNSHLAWLQGAVHYALLGMTREAQALMTRKLDNGPYRFPAFWPPAIDHAPDHNWGGMAMIGLQEMLMQTGTGRILLLPAWPEDWEVDFKLHAPGKTVVAATFKDGKIAKLQVSPAKRGDNVVIWPEAKFLRDPGYVEDEPTLTVPATGEKLKDANITVESTR